MNKNLKEAKRLMEQEIPGFNDGTTLFAITVLGAYLTSIVLTIMIILRQTAPEALKGPFLWVLLLIPILTGFVVSYMLYKLYKGIKHYKKNNKK